MPRRDRLLAIARTTCWWRVLSGMLVVAYFIALLRKHSGYSLPVDGFLYVGGYVVAAVAV